VSRDKILHDSWSISAALAKSFSDRHFERGEGPGDEVDGLLPLWEICIPRIVQAEEILIGCFVECQSIKKVCGRRSVEELYQVLFFASPVAPECFTEQVMISTAIVTSSFHLYFHSSHHFILCYSIFLVLFTASSGKL